MITTASVLRYQSDGAARVFELSTEILSGQGLARGSKLIHSWKVNALVTIDWGADLVGVIVQQACSVDSTGEWVR
jgi:hypothetical protein